MKGYSSLGHNTYCANNNVANAVKTDSRVSIALVFNIVSTVGEHRKQYLCQGFILRKVGTEY